MHRISLGVAVLGCAAMAQQRPVFTAADYARAEKMMGYNTNPLVLRSGIRATWLPDDRFWYRVTTGDGSEFILVDPSRGTREPAFDANKLAAALSKAANGTFDPRRLPFMTIDFSADGHSVLMNASGRRWSCDRNGAQCTSL